MAPDPHRNASGGAGLSLAPLRALRPTVDGEQLARRLCPPYDVIDARAREQLLAADPDNAVAVILPEPDEAGYAGAGSEFERWVADELLAVDETAAIYVYEMCDADGRATRGLVGAIELRDPDDGVILPHENTMAGPVTDRLAVMTATGADLEPIYLVYDGGGAASQLVREQDIAAPIVTATTPDGVTHRLWRVCDPSVLEAVAADLATRRALIADGHHRYATYRERQRIAGTKEGAGAWDRGLALIVDSSDYGPQVHAIHRVIAGLTLDAAVDALGGVARAQASSDAPEQAVAALDATDGFAVVLSDGARSVRVSDPHGTLAERAARPGQFAALSALDVTVLHRALVERVWNLPDDEEHVAYAHSVAEALERAGRLHGIAVLLRPTPVAAVAAVAAAGARMPRKSTLFTPKPASGLLYRRLADQP